MEEERMNQAVYLVSAVADHRGRITEVFFILKHFLYFRSLKETFGSQNLNNFGEC